MGSNCSNTCEDPRTAPDTVSGQQTSDAMVNCVIFLLSPLVATVPACRHVTASVVLLPMGALGVGTAAKCLLSPEIGSGYLDSLKALPLVAQLLPQGAATDGTKAWLGAWSPALHPFPSIKINLSRSIPPSLSISLLSNPLPQLFSPSSWQLIHPELGALEKQKPGVWALAS